MRLLATSVLLLLNAPLGAQSAPGLNDLAFMAGCWEGSFGNGGVIEERYTAPSENVVLGTTRYLSGSRVVQFEFTAILLGADGSVGLRPYPGGQPSDHLFRLTSTGDGSSPAAIFEAPENDFPKRIVYRRAAGDQAVLVARIDNGEGSEQAQEWRMTAAACATR